MGARFLDLPPLDTWLYTVDPEAGGEPQTDVPEYKHRRQRPAGGANAHTNLAIDSP